MNGTVGIDHRRGLADAAISFPPAGHSRAELGHHAGEFVPQHDRIVDRPAMFAGPLVQVAAADADGGHFQQDVFGADRRPRNLAHFDAVFFGREVHDRCLLFHRLSHCPPPTGTSP